MLSFSESVFIDIVVFLAFLTILFVLWVKWAQSYWRRRGLIYHPPAFLVGGAKDLIRFKTSFAELTVDYYKYFKEMNQPHGGFYFLHMPFYMPVDPDIVKDIMLNHFEHFYDRGVYYNEEIDPLSAHLFSLDGTKWRKLRAKLTPTFTSGKMKMMFEMVAKCGDELITEMDKILDGGAIDIKDILGRFTTDVIGSCAFGIECNSLKNPDNEYTKHFKLFFIDDFKSAITGMIAFVAPKLGYAFSIPVVDTKLSKFFVKMIKETVDYREKYNIYRKDFIHLLLQLKNRGKLSEDNKITADEESKSGEEVNLTMNELAAQAFVFFLAAYETSSSTMTFCLFELARNPEIQEKLRAEVVEILDKYDNKLSYEGIGEMRYMDQVINETLRKYPPLPLLNRDCTKTYKEPKTGLVIEKGTKIWIPILALQNDPEYYPNPEVFDPERFSTENKKRHHPYTFLPFGEGPRICIGLRFGLMQTKVGLAYLLKNYRFSLNSKTQLPLKFDPRSFVLNTLGGILLDCNKI